MTNSKSKLRQVDVPEGKSGDWEIVYFKVNKADAQFHNLRASMHPGDRFIQEGVYTKLTLQGSIVVVSDTPAEIRDFSKPVRVARQSYRSESRHVLTNGLGLGIILQAILDDPTIEHLTVIEKSADVIALVAHHWKTRYGNRLTIVHADAFDWKPPKKERYCVVWHDIWNNITSDNLPEMHRLHRKYGRRCDWQGSWCRFECEQAKHREC